MEQFKDFFDFKSTVYTKTTSIILAAVLLFTTGFFMGAFTSDNVNVSDGASNETVQVNAAVQTTAAQTTVPQTTVAVQTALETQTSSNAASGSQASSGAPTTTEEIVALFNKAADGVKTDAVKVVKNFEKRSPQPEKTVVPSALQGTANSLVEEFMKDDNTPIEYTAKEDIVANYPVPGQSYSSKLTAADVKEATCNDLGSEYEITLKLNDTQNPTAGSGVGAACDVIEAEEVTSIKAASAILKEFIINYYDCVIKCKIDKASGHLTWASYVTPLTIECKVSMLVTTVDATVGLTFEKDYTVTY
ncbi:MAG: hypothetical protein ACI4GC_07660 [Acutalibacteraceae bacterium]